MMDVEPHREALFNDLYDNEHLPLLMKLPGSVNAVRYRTQCRRASARYLCAYEVERTDLPMSQALERHLRHRALEAGGAAVHLQQALHRQRADAAMTERALSGMRILDLTQFEAGTTCTQFLGWLGADVLKIEPPGGEQSRRNRPEVPGLDAMFFLVFNANKRSVTIDLKQPDGQDALPPDWSSRRTWWSRTSRPGSWSGWASTTSGSGPRTPHHRGPHQGLRLSGPYHEYKSFDMIAQAMGGVMSVTGFADREPVRCGAAIGDTGTGVHAAGAIMAAYIQRQRTGQGQLVEVAMQEVVANFLRGRYVDHYRDGKPSMRQGQRDHRRRPRRRLSRARRAGPTTTPTSTCSR